MKVMLIGSAGEYGAQLSFYALAEYVSKKIEILVILPEKNRFYEKFKEKGIPCKIVKNGLCWYKDEGKIKIAITFLAKKIINFFAEISIFCLIARHAIDIVHINTIGVTVGAKSALLLKRKLVWHIRESVEENLNRKFYNKERVIRKVGKSDRIITNSQFIYDRYIPFYPDRKKKFAMIYNGVEDNHKKRADSILSREEIKIIIIGRICKEKGQRDLIEALRYMGEYLRRIKVLFVGGCTDREGTNEKKELDERIAQYGLTEQVVFLGYQKDVYEYLKDADICVVSSRYEGFGRVTVEAMMSGALVIGANSGGTPELLLEEYGLLYENGDSKGLAEVIQKAIFCPDKMRKMAQRAQIYAAKTFTVENNAEAVLDIYGSLKRSDRETRDYGNE